MKEQQPLYHRECHGILLQRNQLNN